MRARVTAGLRLAVRILLILILSYSLTAAAAGPRADRYSDYLIDQPSDGQCFDQASQRSGGWVCWMPAPPLPDRP